MILEANASSTPTATTGITDSAKEDKKIGFRSLYGRAPPPPPTYQGKGWGKTLRNCSQSATLQKYGPESDRPVGNFVVKHTVIYTILLVAAVCYKRRSRPLPDYKRQDSGIKRLSEPRIA